MIKLHEIIYLSEHHDTVMDTLETMWFIKGWRKNGRSVKSCTTADGESILMVLKLKVPNVHIMEHKNMKHE